MKKAIAMLKSKPGSPYSQSRYHNTPKKEKELPMDYETRTWRERMHYDEETEYVFIPPMQFKKALELIGRYLGKDAQIEGEGKSKWTKHFEAGVLAFEPVKLNIKKSDVIGEWLFVPADGRAGGSTRVQKCFPKISEWEGKVEFLITDDKINEEVFQRFLSEAGSLIGIGRFRPERRGFYGRFDVVDLQWKEVE